MSEVTTEVTTQVPVSYQDTYDDFMSAWAAIGEAVTAFVNDAESVTVKVTQQGLVLSISVIPLPDPNRH